MDTVASANACVSLSVPENTVLWDEVEKNKKKERIIKKEEETKKEKEVY